MFTRRWRRNPEIVVFQKEKEAITEKNKTEMRQKSL